MSPKSKGQIAYEAYMENGETTPYQPWEEVQEFYKEKWEVAANAVVEAVLAE